MARITIEDCIKVVHNPFDLVVLAAKRARDVSAGASITVSRDNDKNPVVALREIAQKTICADNLSESVIRGMQRSHFVDDQEDEGDDMDDHGVDNDASDQDFDLSEEDDLSDEESNEAEDEA